MALCVCMIIGACMHMWDGGGKHAGVSASKLHE